jgi:predicted metal-dependent phosphotriesterase family hydrolase
MTTVETVLGRIDAAELGAVDAHEHLFLRTPALPGEELDDLAQLVTEVESVKRAGIDTIVELTPVGLGRAPDGLAELSRRTGVRVVAATGFHRDAHYPAGHWVHREPIETLVEVMVTDLTEGMDAGDWQGPVHRATPHRAGIVKLGASYHRISASEARRLDAGAEAARRTGAPIAVHCEIGTMGHEILDQLSAAGVSPSRVLLAHLDRNPDPELHAELAARGAWLLYDSVGKVKYRPDSALIELIGAVVAAGHADRLLLGTDTARRSGLRAAGGGPGMAVLGESFLPRLSRHLGQSIVDQVIRTNPAQALQWLR